MDHTSYHPQISMDAIFDYQPGKAIPQIEMKMIHHQVQEGQLMDENVTVEIRGLTEPASFRLTSTHHTATTCPGQFTQIVAVHVCLLQTIPSLFPASCTGTVGNSLQLELHPLPHVLHYLHTQPLCQHLVSAGHGELCTCMYVHI